MLMQTLLCAGKTQIYDERGSQNHIHRWCVVTSYLRAC